jgi:GTP cyclohydrolase I
MSNQTIREIQRRFQEDGIAFKANDNIAQHLLEGEMEAIENEVENCIEDLLQALIIDTQSDHNTFDTPKRMAKMFCHEIFKGRFEKVPKLTEFPNVKKLDEMYCTGPITIRSTCAHHFCPIVGKAWIGVIPGETIIGLSKFNRVVDWIASRPQIQEELVVQIADYIEREMKPLGLAVVIEATHFCMTWRGVKEPDTATMTTSVMRGSFKDKPATRAEFLTLIKR